ncbi:MAG: hypothetical protein IJ009_00840 [Clostridia bacterium]|nr:hypothetical protein [Clostridia bacterium]
MIIQELWHGNILPQQEEGKHEEEIKELRALADRNRDMLKAHLNEEGLDRLERYDENLSELMSLREEDIFENAFRLGVRLAIECLMET